MDYPFGGVRGPSNAEYPTLAAAIHVADGDMTKEYFVSPLPRMQYQAHAGACVAHGFSYAAEAAALQTGSLIQLCRQDLYFGARWLRGWEREDSGCLLPDMARWMWEYGCLSEDRKPWDASDVTTWRPPATLTAERLSLSCKYNPLPQIAAAIVGELALNRAVPFAHYVTNGMLNPVNGVERWSSNEGRKGAHCRAIVGYSPGKGFLVANSWKGWGVPHPTMSLSHRDSFSWVPVETMVHPGFGFDFHRLSQPLPVENV